MTRDDAIELVSYELQNVHDMDTPWSLYASAAVKALGWRSLETDVPEIDHVVVCTDGKHRWLDKRTAYLPDMIWQGHKPTHWHPILGTARPHHT